MAGSRVRTRSIDISNYVFIGDEVFPAFFDIKSNKRFPCGASFTSSTFQIFTIREK